MRRILRALAALLTLLALAGAALWLSDRREGWPAAARVPAPEPGADLDAWLALREGVFDDIIHGTEKAINWAGTPGERTPLAVVYIHGFSASRQEISPVPENVAAALGANYFGTRLAGHGRDGAALGEASVDDWARDIAEAMAIGRRLGERVVLIGTSTGGSLATLAALDPAYRDDIAAVIAISPNFALADRQAWTLDLPWAPFWLPRVGGAERSFEPYDERHALYWTERYPTQALFPLRAVQRAAAAADHASARVPLLVFYAANDVVVVSAATARVVQHWGARVDAHLIDNADDPGQHVITGDIRSPSTTGFVTATILAWLADL